jgi:hypothetical protein
MLFNRRTVAVLGGLGLALAGGSVASAGGLDGQPVGAQAGPAEIQMKLDGRRLRFAGPAQVVAGEELQIRNTTAIRTIGPHTFSLTTQGRLPKTARARRNCFAPRRICRRIAVAHEFDFRRETIGRDVVRAGGDGWDRSFARSGRGDSWYTDGKGQTFAQTVTADPGTTLRFMCAVHPGMQGKIDVVAGSAPTP